jgi:YfiH family protein
MALLRFGILQPFPELVHGISDRTMGSVYPEEEGGRLRLAQALGLAPGALVPTRQVHGDEIVLVPGPGYGCWHGQHGADGLITATPGLFLMGYFADCVPILAYDPVQRAAGLVHAGWRGTLLRIAERLVAEMGAAFGAQPQDLRVGIGPSIGPCCYEVGAEVIAGVQERLPGGETLLRPGRPGHAFLDLWAANRQGLLRAGVLAEHVEVSERCTSCQAERFFSYRREGRLNGLFGAVIGLRGSEDGGTGGQGDGDA